VAIGIVSYTLISLLPPVIELTATDRQTDRPRQCVMCPGLFQTYCNSRYGCELWSLYDNNINDFDVAWRKVVRRVLDIPYDTHSNLIPLLMSNTPLFFDEICKRSARFILSCIQSEWSFVRSVVTCSILSVVVFFIGRNVLFLSRVSILTRDIAIANRSVCPSVRLSVRLSVMFRYQIKTA